MDDSGGVDGGVPNRRGVGDIADHPLDPAGPAGNQFDQPAVLGKVKDPDGQAARPQAPDDPGAEEAVPSRDQDRHGLVPFAGSGGVLKMSCRRPDQTGEAIIADDNSFAASSKAGTSCRMRGSVNRRCGPAMLTVPTGSDVTA